MYVLTNGQMIMEDQILHHHAVVIENDRIKAIIPEEDIGAFNDCTIIDAKAAIFHQDLLISIPII